MITPTIFILVGGLAVLLGGVGLLGTVLGLRATAAEFGHLQIGLIMAGYYAGYIVGTLFVPKLIRNVGHVRCFAAFAAVAAAANLRNPDPPRPPAGATGRCRYTSSTTR